MRRLAGCPSTAHVGAMFSVDETTARTIRQVFEEKGELSAVAELRRYFPGITDNENARRCVRVIAGWTPPIYTARSAGEGDASGRSTADRRVPKPR